MDRVLHRDEVVQMFIWTKMRQPKIVPVLHLLGLISIRPIKKVYLWKWFWPQTDRWAYITMSTRQRKPDYAAEHESKSCITLCDQDKYISSRQRVYLNVKVVLTRQRLRLPLNTHCIYTLVVYHVQRGSVTFSFRYSTFQKHKLHKSLATHLYL